MYNNGDDKWLEVDELKSFYFHLYTPEDVTVVTVTVSLYTCTDLIYIYWKYLSHTFVTNKCSRQIQSQHDQQKEENEESVRKLYHLTV